MSLRGRCIFFLLLLPVIITATHTCCFLANYRKWNHTQRDALIFDVCFVHKVSQLLLLCFHLLQMLEVFADLIAANLLSKFTRETFYWYYDITKAKQVLLCAIGFSTFSFSTCQISSHSSVLSHLQSCSLLISTFTLTPLIEKQPQNSWKS